MTHEAWIPNYQTVNGNETVRWANQLFSRDPITEVFTTSGGMEGPEEVGKLQVFEVDGEFVVIERSNIFGAEGGEHLRVLTSDKLGKQLRLQGQEDLKPTKQ